MTKPATQRAAYQRRYRARRQRGEAVLPPLSLPPEVVAAMIASGRITEIESRDRAALAREAAAILGEWARLWLQK